MNIYFEALTQHYNIYLSPYTPAYLLASPKHNQCVQLCTLGAQGGSLPRFLSSKKTQAACYQATRVSSEEEPGPLVMRSPKAVDSPHTGCLHGCYTGKTGKYQPLTWLTAHISSPL